MMVDEKLAFIVKQVFNIIPKETAHSHQRLSTFTEQMQELQTSCQHSRVIQFVGKQTYVLVFESVALNNTFTIYAFVPKTSACINLNLLWSLLYFIKDMFCSGRQLPRPRSFITLSRQTVAHFASFATLTSANF